MTTLLAIELFDLQFNTQFNTELNTQLNPQLNMQIDWQIILEIAAAFLCGSIPFGVLIAKSKGVDLRKVGSGNVGATNVGRALGRKWGFMCFALDAIKGALPVLIIGQFNGVLGRQVNTISPTAFMVWIVIAIAAIAGHIFSPWLKFKGGKGVATGFGALVAMWPVLTYPMLIALAVWIVCMKLSRIVSLSSLIAALTLPISAALLLPWNTITQKLATGSSAPTSPAPLETTSGTPLPAVVACAMIAALVFITHRANIKRLLLGTESRVGQKPKSSDTIPL